MGLARQTGRPLAYSLMRDPLAWRSVAMRVGVPHASPAPPVAGKSRADVALMWRRRLHCLMCPGMHPSLINLALLLILRFNFGLGSAASRPHPASGRVRVCVALIWWRWLPCLMCPGRHAFNMPLELEVDIYPFYFCPDFSMVLLSNHPEYPSSFIFESIHSSSPGFSI